MSTDSREIQRDGVGTKRQIEAKDKEKLREREKKREMMMPRLNCTVGSLAPSPFIKAE